jgi:hypothetical protein
MRKSLDAWAGVNILSLESPLVLARHTRFSFRTCDLLLSAKDPIDRAKGMYRSAPDVPIETVTYHWLA